MRRRVAVIERNLAQFAGVDFGDRVTLTTAAGPAQFRIIGMVTNQQEDGTVLYVPLTTLRSVLDQPTGVSTYWSKTTSPDKSLINRTTTLLDDRLTALGYDVATEISYVMERDEIEENRTITTTIAVLGFLIVAMSMVGLANAITMSIIERTREIGILRCIGARARDVRRIFATEGVTLALFGWLLGLPLGYTLTRLIVWLIWEIAGVRLPVVFPFWDIWIALAGTVALALLVLLLPLRRAVASSPGRRSDTREGAAACGHPVHVSRHLKDGSMTFTRDQRPSLLPGDRPAASIAAADITRTTARGAVAVDALRGVSLSIGDCDRPPGPDLDLLQALHPERAPGTEEAPMISVRGVAGRTARSCSGRCRTVARMWRPQGPVRRGLAPASQPLRPASRIIEHAPSDGSCRARASWSRRASLRPVTRLLALPLVLVAFASANASAAELPFRSSVRPLPASLEADLAGGYWRPGCPVPLSQLRLLTVAHWGFDGGVRSGQLVVAREYADDLRGVFRKLYDLRFPIRHMRLSDSYGLGGRAPGRR